MSQFTGFAYSCDRSLDPQQNADNLQGMIDKINSLVEADGWNGVRVITFYPYQNSIALQVAPGVSELTLEYLRSVGVIVPVADKQPERLSA